ncbi:MAG: GTP pyrophosphokinase family protein [Eubacterium sp.]
MSSYELKTLINDKNGTSITDGLEDFFEHALLFQEMMMRYECAILEIKTKLEVLNKDMSVRYKRNPINSIKTRIKSPESIVSKLKRKNLGVTVENMQSEIKDVAGLRVICSYIDDIYEVANMLANQDDINILEVKDYIKSPKPNGYRSYHIILEVPVFFSDSTMPMKAEVQIRTMAMDFWASLDHDLRYKKEYIENYDEIMAELTSCATVINETDVCMQNLRQKIDKHM